MADHLADSGSRDRNSIDSWCRYYSEYFFGIETSDLCYGDRAEPGSANLVQTLSTRIGENRGGGKQRQRFGDHEQVARQGEADRNLYMVVDYCCGCDRTLDAVLVALLA